MRIDKNANIAVIPNGINDHICVNITTDNISPMQIIRKSFMLHSHSLDAAFRFCGYIYVFIKTSYANFDVTNFPARIAVLTVLETLTDRKSVV